MIDYPSYVAKAVKLPPIPFERQVTIRPEEMEAVYMNEAALTSARGARYLGTVNSGDCYTVVLRNPEDGQTGIMHCNQAMQLSALKWMIGEMRGQQARPLDAYVIGGLDIRDEKLVKAIGEERANDNIRRGEAVLKMLYETPNITLRGADILGRDKHEDFGVDTKTGRFFAGDEAIRVIEEKALMHNIDHEHKPQPTIIGEPDKALLERSPNGLEPFMKDKLVGGVVHLFYDGRENAIPPGTKIMPKEQGAMRG
jgi:hypothetical protein